MTTSPVTPCAHANESVVACTCLADCPCRIPQGGKCPPVSDVERPEKFEPFEKWKATWKPYDKYITLTEAYKRITEAGAQLTVLGLCQVIGHTMHVEREIPPEAWSSAEWNVVPEENRVGKAAYAEHLQFQVQVFEADLQTALAPAEPEPEPERVTPPVADAPQTLSTGTVEHPGVPSGWVLQTVEGVAWQAVSPESVYGPIRPEIGLAVGDAWSQHTQQCWI